MEWADDVKSREQTFEDKDETIKDGSWRDEDEIKRRRLTTWKHVGRRDKTKDETTPRRGRNAESLVTSLEAAPELAADPPSMQSHLLLNLQT